MKKALLFLFAMMLTVATLFAQAPQKMSYQAVVRNANNTLVTNQNVSARISILQGSVNGTPVYVETHSTTTNINGLLTVEVGEGTAVSGTMSGIDWANGPFYLKSEIDPNGGVNYSIEGVQQLMSVPYALYAGQAGNVPAFAITPVDTTGYMISITQPGGQPQTFLLTNGTQGPAGPQGPQGNPGTPGTPGADGVGIDSIAKTGTNGLVDTYTIYYSNNTTATFNVTNGADGQGIAQTLTIAGNQLSISGGNTVTIPTGGDGTGTPGADGVGIDSIAKTGTNANVDTYTIYYSNNTTSTFTVTNGVDGAPGEPGAPGVPGEPGTPAPIPVFTYSMNADSTVLIITVTVGDNTQSWQIPVGAGGSGGTQMNASWSVTDPTSPAYIIDKPTNVSAFTNDAGYITMDSIPAIPTVPTNVSAFTNDAGYITMDSIPAIPTVPSNVGAFTNDAGYITSAEVPTLNVTQTDTGYVLTVTQPGGTAQTYILRNGVDGAPGAPGTPGDPGAPGEPGTPAPIPVFTHSMNADSTVLTITVTVGDNTQSWQIPVGAGGSGGTQMNASWSVTDPTSPAYIIDKPTNVSAFTNDAGYITMDSIPAIPTVPTNVSAFTNDAGYITMDSIPAIPTVPTNVSAFTNDAGYLTSYTETDPTVPAWAKENTKPTYDYSEIQNTPTIPTVPTNVSAFTNDAGYITMDSIPAIPTVPTNVSAFTNDAGYITMDSIPAIPTVPTNVSAFSNDAGYITMDSIPAIPTVPTNVSAFTNDAGYLTMDSLPTIPDAQVNADWDATSGVAEILNKPDIAGMQNAIDSMQNSMRNLQNNLEDELGFVCGISKVKDYDGNEYNTVKIGSQCWLKENLKTAHYSDGTEIPYSTTLSTTVGCRYYPNDDSANVAKFGYLYNWPATMNSAEASNDAPSGVQGACPKGWHVPSTAEFSKLWACVRYDHPDWHCNSYYDNLAKALAATTDWLPSTTECAVGNDLTQNNASGFSALPAGCNRSTSYFSQMAQFWTTSYYNNESNQRTTWGLNANHYRFTSSHYTLDYGCSIRCLKDETSSSINTLENQINQLQNYIDSVTNTFTCGVSKVKDYDGNEYNTVKIGEQCWMKENMRAKHFSDGTAIPTGTDSSWTSPFYYYHSASSHYNLEELGYYYNWPAAMNVSASSSSNPSGVQGVCPTGWHIPSIAEWNQLFSYARTQSSWFCNDQSTNIGKALASDKYWGANTTTCAPGNDYTQNNASCFSAIAGGYAYFSTAGVAFGYNHGFQFMAWSSDIATGNDKAKYVYIGYQYPGAYTNLSGYSIGYALSVRCLRDPETNTAPTTLTPADVQNMINNSLTPLYQTIDSMQNVINHLQHQLEENHICGFSKVKDYDGNEYNTVKIGNQCWMKENLRTSHYSDGTEIPLGTDSSSTIGYRYCPNNASANVPVYGYLYNWLAMMNGAAGSDSNPSGVQGVCPTGWHVPSSNELGILVSYASNHFGNDCGGTAKSLADSILWNPSSTNCNVGNNLSANNASGFSALPAGVFSYQGNNYQDFRTHAFFWTTAPATSDPSKAYLRWIGSNYNYVGGLYNKKGIGMSVRCLQD